MYWVCAKLLKHQGVGQTPRDQDLKEQRFQTGLDYSLAYNQIAELDEHQFCYYKEGCGENQMGS